MIPRLVVGLAKATHFISVFRALLCPCVFLCLCSITAFAQDPSYRFDHWTTDNGLPHNSIWALRQTRDGYLWLATGDGLVRFDGVRFRVFNKANTPGLANAGFSAYALLEDRQGALWAGTWSGGAVRYYGGVFSVYTTKNGLPDDRVERIDEDADGAVWIFTRRGLARWKNGQLERVERAPGSFPNDNLVEPNKLAVDAIYCGLWRHSAAGWERFAYGRWSPFPLPPDWPYLKDPAKLRIGSIIEDPQRRVWYNLKDRPGERYCVSDGQLTVYRGLPPNSLVCYGDGQGRLWLTDHDGHTAVWKDGRPTPLEGLSTPSVFRVYEDREGGIWIGTKNDGLRRLRQQPVTVHHRPGGAWFNIINSVLEGRDGTVWLGGSGGLGRFKDGRFSNYTRPGATLWEYPNIMSALFEDRDGAIRVGAWSGVALFREGRLVEDKALSPRIGGRVNVIHRDRSGDLWFGGELGLYRFGADRRNGYLSHYTTRDGLAGNNVKAICEDREGALWVGTGNGLSRFAGEGFSTLTEADGLSSNRVISIYEDGAGVLWVGTLDGGLNRLARSSVGVNGQGQTKITRYTTEHGLFSNAIHQILEDGRGSLWFSCHLGVFRVGKQELNDFADGRVSRITSIRFGKADGFISEECSFSGQPAGLKARDGRLWFPTQNGVAVIDPKAALANTQPPPVVIEAFLLDGQPARFDGVVQIAPGKENFEIEYTALSFTNSEQIKFKYKLAGLDHDWVDAGGRRTAYYPHVPPGEYTFTVIAANSDGVWNNKGASLDIFVATPFYRAWWFITLVSLSLAGIALFIYSRRFAALRARHVAQEAFSRQLMQSQEDERKRIAAELHDSLGQSLAIIKNRALLSLGAPDDHERALEQLREISEASAEVIDEVKEIAHNLRPYQLDRLGLTKTIEGMIRKVAETHDLHFAVEIDRVDKLFTPEGEINLFRIVQESVNNIVKHAAATEASVTIKHKEQSVFVTIRDNGRGFDAAAPSAASSTPRGFGLIGMAERARVLGGNYEIHSVPEQGTTMTLIIDLPIDVKAGER